MGNVATCLLQPQWREGGNGDGYGGRVERFHSSPRSSSGDEGRIAAAMNAPNVSSLPHHRRRRHAPLRTAEAARGVKARCPTPPQKRRPCRPSPIFGSQRSSNSQDTTNHPPPSQKKKQKTKNKQPPQNLPPYSLHSADTLAHTAMTQSTSLTLSLQCRRASSRSAAPPQRRPCWRPRNWLR